MPPPFFGERELAARLAKEAGTNPTYATGNAQGKERQREERERAREREGADGRRWDSGVQSDVVVSVKFASYVTSTVNTTVLATDTRYKMDTVF